MQDLDVNRKTILPHILNKCFCDVTGEEPVSDSCEHGFYKNDRDVFNRSATISIPRITLFHVFFDVLLTVHLSIFFSVINQLDAQNFVHQVG